jgi:hypothetical protein
MTPPRSVTVRRRGLPRRSRHERPAPVFEPSPRPLGHLLGGWRFTRAHLRSPSASSPNPLRRRRAMATRCACAACVSTRLPRGAPANRFEEHA